MRETHDTVDGLLAEFRGYSAGMPPSYHVTMSWADFRKMLDRFDAANKREVQNALDAGGFVEASRKNKQVGDAAKLREALKATLDLLWDIHNANRSPQSNQAYAVIRQIKAALAAPPRNCDIYLTEEAVDAATVTVRDCEACSRIDMEAPCVFCMVRWLLAPATEKEGGAK